MAAPAQVNLHIHDVGKEFEYFTDVLGFEPDFRVRENEHGAYVYAGVKWGRHFTLVLGGIEEALHGHYDHGDFGRQMEEHPLGTGVVLHFLVPNVDKKYADIVQRGATIDEPPTDQFWGERTISVVTPAGFYVTFAQPIKGFRFPPAFEQRLERFGAAGPKKRKVGPRTKGKGKRRRGSR